MYSGLINYSGCGMGVKGGGCFGRGHCVPEVHWKKLAPMIVSYMQQWGMGSTEL